MLVSRISKAVSMALVLAATPAIANENVDVITVTAPTTKTVNVQDTAMGSSIAPDLAGWLDSVPGANVNRNRPVTGIAQYRGMFGDRVAVAVDGHTIIGAGPNAMDAPMSYVTPLIVESVSLYRGITPVSAAIDTLGGNVDIKMRKASFGDSNEYEVDGAVLAGYRFENEADTLASVVNLGSESQAIMLFANSQTGDSYKDGDGRLITPTQFDKKQAGVDYRFKLDKSEVGISYHYSDTQDSGTPALPMDIDFIKGHRLNLDGKFLWNEWNVDWLVGYLDAEHGMDNFRMRSNMNEAMYRNNYATAESTDFKIRAQQSFGDHRWLVGIDGIFSEHDSTITNPNNTMFNVANFNAVEDNRFSAFAQWDAKYGDDSYSLGLRVKHNQADADEVSHHMAGANMMIAQLVNGINDADRSVSDTNFDIVLNTRTVYDEHTTLSAGVAVKQRAPSYQERYLWMPMEATGGLADGKTYIGNINLKSETAYQLDLGLNYHNGDFYFAPHIYYHRVDDYIQGTPTDSMAAKMVANMMMGDESPLQFSNVDAEIFGGDVRWHYMLSNSFKLSGQASYVRGQRRDVEDGLYRIAPLNASIALTYMANNWQAELELKGVDEQDKISDTNFEMETPGYGLLNFSAVYDFNDSLTLRAGADNLLDRQYRSHLTGYYRVNNGGVEHMSRVPGEGVNYFVEASYQF